MTAFPYTLQEDPRPAMGLVVLQVDETIEQDFRQLFAPKACRLHITRVPSGAELTPDTIATMATALAAAAALLPREAALRVVGYACTSGTTLIGTDRVQSLITSVLPTGAVTNPLAAALHACRTLNLTRIGIVSPYIPTVAEPIRNAFEQGGLTVPETISFGEEIEARVARIAPTSIAEAARTLAARNQLDGIFLSCTNLRTLGIIPELEADLGLPVLSSNQVLAWHMAQLAGVPMSCGSLTA
ncbi:aspartate/glutamate racemase family protein [Donghicola mangrovi]|uniref:Asp/Glu racemase n=1 Tax=Donghicola mangrovi TaxID=2729614 RepID=A0A850Q2R4_9RHOB|nr:aspartate/glutamate racemase family protein [Donghicola mangrovi]NVO23273.1 Asp/Glu racemase [Donghicola mangrovi]